jgi:hypothetical protein
VSAYDGFVTKSERMLRYTLKDSRGRLVGSCETPAAIERFGHLGVIPRADLICLLEEALDGLRFRRGVSVGGGSGRRTVTHGRGAPGHTNLIGM